MNPLLRSIMLGGTAAIALAAGTARAHDVEHARPRPAPVVASAPPRGAPGDHDRDRPQMEREYREYRELAGARERFYRGWRGDRHARDQFERWCALRRAELDRRWANRGLRR
jgi:hypothetical protein